MARFKETSKRGRNEAKDISSANAKVPDVYKEMLVDTISSATQINDAGKIVKRRRVAGRIITQGQGITDSLDEGSSLPSGTEHADASRNLEPAMRQTAYNESEDSAESDLDWEEVDLKKSVAEDFLPENLSNQADELNLVLDEDSSRSRGQQKIKRVPVTAAERQVRLETHKVHLLSLLVHIHLRNHWCNEGKVHGALKRLLSNRTLSYLNPDEKHSQFQRSRSFIDGLKQASESFRENFKITSRGMSRSFWAETAEALAERHLPEDLELPMQKDDFCAAALSLEASRDVGAQLFCALLRSAGVETRLVCSLQPLPFNVTAIPGTSLKKESTVPTSRAEVHTPMNDDEIYDDARETQSSSMSKPTGSTGPRRILSGVQMRTSQTLQSGGISVNRGTSPTRIHKKPVKESPYPVFWTEAFNEADQKWVPVDPLIIKTISKPSSFEPPASDTRNSLTYVIAFESDGSARDVTRRYAKAFNAKTRRGRLEFVKGGETWWRRILKMYTRSYDLPRDQIEDSELVAKEAAEPMPKNALDFKNHPYYALERHLKRSEVIHPKREVGKVAAGRSGGNQILEPVFRRRDVHVVKSGDSWYRLGREIKIGEQPLKHVPSRRGKERVEENDDTKEDSDVGMALYAYHQTQQYSAPPVINGRIPKNVYGNLDIYVPSMVPKDGVHVPHPDTSRAARLLGVDYADAVTGFAFRGRHGTAIITGAVVANSCRDAIEEVINAFEIEKQKEEEKERMLEALRMWKKLLIGLRIRERIQGYEIEGEREAVDEAMGDEEESAYDEDGGGFVPEREMTEHSKPLSLGNFEQKHDTCDDDDGGGGFLHSDEDDNEDGATISKPEKDNFHETPWRFNYQRPQGKLTHENLDIKQHSQPRRQDINMTAKPSQKYPRSFQTESSYLPQTTQPTHPNPPSSPSNPDLPDAELAEALALQQIHDIQSQQPPNAPPPLAHQESNVGTSHLPPSASSHHQRSSKPSPPAHNAPPLPPTQVSPSSPPRENLDITHPTTSSSSVFRQEEEQVAEEDNDQAEPEKKSKDNDNYDNNDDSEDAGSLLSHDPSDEEADPSWLDF